MRIIRTVLVTVAAAFVAAAFVAAALVAACSAPITPPAPTSSTPTCDLPASAEQSSADLSTVDGWMLYLREHPDDYALDIQPMRGTPIRHNATKPMPTASAIKLVHLAAYTQAVAAGNLNPDDTVTTADWERWYFPLDGGAHVASLKYLGIPASHGIAADHTRRITYRQLADVMIRFSDSAAPDLFREKLGDNALRDISGRFGFSDDPPSLLGLYLALVDPGLTTATQRDQAARRYHDDPAYATQQLLRIRTVDTATVSSESTIEAAPASLQALMSAIADGSLGPGAAEARRILEFHGPQKDGSVLGFKGGSLPGVRTEVFEYRAADGTTAVGTFMVKDLAREEAERAGFTHQQLLLSALTDDRTAARLRCLV